MRHANRTLTTLVATGVAGVLIWFVPHFHRWTTGGYWASMALFVIAGIVLGISQLHGRRGTPTSMFAITIVPVAIVVGWVLLAAQPRGNWFRDHAADWSGDIGLGHVVHNLGEHPAVLAFALGMIFGLHFELAMIRRPARTKKVVLPPPPAPVATTVETTEPLSVPEAEQPTVVERPAGDPPV